VAADRQTLFDFAPPHLKVDHGYLVAGDRAITTMAELDRPGVRVALVTSSASDLALSRLLRYATVMRGRDLAALIDLVLMGEADVIVAQKTNLHDIAPRLPGSRVLDGRPGSEEQAMAVPKGRAEAGLAYVRQFVQEAKREGLVQKAADRVGLKGVAVAP
jgi:polar amino acid transport system substrate-binding protein